MPAPAPRTFYVITTRGDIGPYTRTDLREQLQSGAVRSDDRVRNAFGRPLGTVTEALSETSSSRTPAYAGPPVVGPPPPGAARRRSPIPLIIGLVAAALIGAAVLASTLSAPAVPVATPAPPVVEAPQPAAPAPPADTAQPSVAVQPTTPPQDGALPDGWTFLDLGDARPKGKASVAAGLWTVEGGGEDVWNKRDECGFVHREHAGDFSMVVRVVSTQDTNQWDKIGIMVRSSVDASSPMVYLFVTHNGTARLTLRKQANANADGPGSASVRLPAWLQLTRRGKTFGGYWSLDGKSWTGVGNKVDLGNVTPVARLGLAVCSHNRSIANRAVFDNVSVTAPR